MTVLSARTAGNNHMNSLGWKPCLADSSLERKQQTAKVKYDGRSAGSQNWTATFVTLFPRIITQPLKPSKIAAENTFFFSKKTRLCFT